MSSDDYNRFWWTLYDRRRLRWNRAEMLCRTRKECADEIFNAAYYQRDKPSFVQGKVISPRYLNLYATRRPRKYGFAVRNDHILSTQGYPVTGIYLTRHPDQQFGPVRVLFAEPDI